MLEATLLLADDEPITRMDLRETLEEMGYQVVGEAGDGWEAVQMAQRLRPAVTIMDIKMPKLDGLVAAQKIIDQGLGSVVLLSAYSQKDLVEKAQRAGVAGYLVKPVRESELIPAIELAVARQRQISLLEQEVAAAKEELESRKLAERAKGLLMSTHGWTEEAAWRWLQKTAMSRHISLEQLSREIIGKLTRE